MTALPAVVEPVATAESADNSAADNLRWPVHSKISVIIPALNEEHLIAETMVSTWRGKPGEIIVVDGGSRDRTVQIAGQRGAKVLHSRPSRGAQLALGADAARGDLLIFLHADTRLPSGYAQIVEHMMSDPRVAVGAFSLRVDSPQRRYRVMERLVGWRSRWLHLPYGDQALFVRRTALETAGGVPAVPLLEDWEMVRRLRRVGRVVVVREHVTTSPRRWQESGFLRTTAVNLACLGAHQLGCSAETLCRWREGQLRRRGTTL